MSGGRVGGVAHLVGSRAATMLMTDLHAEKACWGHTAEVAHSLDQEHRGCTLALLPHRPVLDCEEARKETSYSRHRQSDRLVS